MSPSLHAAVLALLPWLPGTGIARTPQASDELLAKLESIRAAASVPALGAAIVDMEGLEGAWVVGMRRAGGSERAASDDLWHLGSCSKSMTATLIALLVARGDLAWDTPLGEALPELAGSMDESYLDLTLIELMSHRGGLANAIEEDPPASLSLPEQRERVVRAILERPPVHPPRGAFLYSNFDFVVAGHLAERATHTPWETLMQELLFRPLGMESAGFGAPGTPERCDQPRGHTPTGLPVEPGPDADNPPWIGPAGTVHASLADWAKYLRLHLQGSRGDVRVGALTLTKETFARLHRAYPAPGAPRYALGWIVGARAPEGGGGETLWHNGSNTLWYCEAWLAPARGFATLVVMNEAPEVMRRAADETTVLLIAQHEGLQAPGPAR